MIFVTVGSQVPFDRMIKAVDEWASSQQGHDVIGQVGSTEYVATSMTTHESMSPAEYSKTFAAADLVIGHAGMGTIISAFEQGKRLLMMPRRASLGEHRNDHQLATIKRFGEYPGIVVAMEAEEIPHAIEGLLRTSAPEPGAELPGAENRERLINYLRSVVQG
jgi:UDP-N-acetylglucosamine transferase subunit ALG13